MERSAWPKNLSSSRKRAIQDLLHGQNPTKKLADLSDAHSQTSNDTGQLLFAEHLVVNVLGSFSNTLSLSSSDQSDEVLQVRSNACVRYEVSEGSESINTPLPRAHGGGERCNFAACTKNAEGVSSLCISHGVGRQCTKSAEGRTDYRIAHGGRRWCSHDGCTRAARGKSGLCIRHGGGKRCQIEGCTKSAKGLSGLCISHGGGRRCQYIGCIRAAQGRTLFCKAHGGGKRCTFAGCIKGAEGSTPFCKGHGGGKRCSFQGGGVCPKSVHWGTAFCVAHGGGKRCAVPGCTKRARGRTDLCVRHGGGKRCQVPGCGKSARGSVDFCKAHGDGKRCAWGHPGSGFGGEDSGPCNSFACGKTGLCALHSGWNLIDDDRHQWRTYHQDSIIEFELPGKNSNLWWTTRVSCDLDDEYRWRMIVDQGIIPELPGSYFRCAHQIDQGCPATKLVRKMSDDPPVYVIAYRGRHTCNEFHSEPTVILDSPGLLDSSILPIFNTDLIAKQDNNNIHFSSSTFSSVNHQQRLASKDDLNPHGHGDDGNSNNNNQSTSSGYYTALEFAGEIEAPSIDQGGCDV